MTLLSSDDYPWAFTILIALIGYLGLFFASKTFTLSIAFITNPAKKDASEPINLEDIEVLQQFTNASEPRVETFIAISFCEKITKCRTEKLL